MQQGKGAVCTLKLRGRQFRRFLAAEHLEVVWAFASFDNFAEKALDLTGLTSTLTAYPAPVPGGRSAPSYSM